MRDKIEKRIMVAKKKIKILQELVNKLEEMQKKPHHDEEIDELFCIHYHLHPTEKEDVNEHFPLCDFCPICKDCTHKVAMRNLLCDLINGGGESEACRP